MEFRADLQAFNRRNIRSVELARKNQARVDRLAVEQNGARAAIAGTAPLFGSGQPDLVSQKIQQQAMGGNVAASFLAVQSKFNFRFHGVQYLLSRRSAHLRGGLPEAALSRARLVIARTIARRESAYERTSLIGLHSLAASTPAFSARSSVNARLSTTASALLALIGVGETAPRAIRTCSQQWVWSFTTRATATPT